MLGIFRIYFWIWSFKITEENVTCLVTFGILTFLILDTNLSYRWSTPLFQCDRDPWMLQSKCGFDFYRWNAFEMRQHDSNDECQMDKLYHNIMWLKKASRFIFITDYHLYTKLKSWQHFVWFFFCIGWIHAHQIRSWNQNSQSASQSRRGVASLAGDWEYKTTVSQLDGNQWI